MNIDWFTFIAQIVNFLLLVGLLQWFLYGPIVRAMQQRADKVAGRLEDAERKQREADEQVQQYEQKNQEIEMQREELLKEARREAHQQHERLIKQAREAVAERRGEWLHAFDRERQEMLDELRLQIGRLAENAARHMLTELASDDLEQRMLREFVSRLQQLDDQQREEIRAHLQNGESNLYVRSAFDVSKEWRDRLREVIGQNFAHDEDISFETSADLICGLELDVGGYSFGWNVNELLRNIELDFGERLSKKK